MAASYHIKQKETRVPSCTLNIIIAGAGIAGLGAAISCLLAGHNVQILEATSEIKHVGAGIQVLPNGSRILKHWGLEEKLSMHWAKAEAYRVFGWKGNQITSMNVQDTAGAYPGTWFRAFYRPYLQRTLLERIVELGGNFTCNAKIVDVAFGGDGSTATITTASGRQFTADLFIGADGIFGKLADLVLDHPTPPTKTGDLAYRVMLASPDIVKDPDLADFVTKPNMNFWYGPEKHVVAYPLSKELFNMVLLTPDDIPEDSKASTVAGNVEEMRSLFKDWDPRISKLLKLCKSVHKWRLCTRFNTGGWAHPSGAGVMIGDSVHATLPYLAAGAGMALEDGAVLGECLSRLPNDPHTTKSSRDFLLAKRHALAVFEKCRKQRTLMVVTRSNEQKDLEHLADGPEQELRDRQMQMVPTPPGEALVWRDPAIAPELFGWDHVVEVNSHWGIPSIPHATTVGARVSRL
ncbi:FAD/NAD(P)-binding domain-containing protein [Aspergillus saccharolyticus JOP 1030-1]|uniref:FAD/NAD(P)-binding domain-containing protein n=1 Tax=Aspergillus saccharolyticus JOP 1030-1 TaxID=1450539 RepID=A0A318Z5Z3_9EURO|nr:FAD/NAD(P)-binding domain-containing protein [Aspergillus saccharolyticus JOP 1030-1]PYH42526.1 FAD/NAD(P)-binding domain-containing protein [Aspergillus saccharolyticus JOP 1030-1]